MKVKLEDLTQGASDVRECFVRDKDGYLCSATLISSEEKTNRVAILVPGFGAIKEDSSKNLLIPGLLKSGISVLLFDLYGHGQSEGKIFDLRPSSIASEVEAVIDFLIVNGYSAIALYASSFPTLGAVIVPSEYHEKIKVLILQSPIFDIQRYAEISGNENWLAVGHISHAGSSGTFELGTDYYVDAMRFRNVGSNLANISEKTLVIIGGKDKYVSTDAIRAYASKIHDCELMEYKDSDHTITEDKDDLTRKVSEFINTNL